MIANSNSWNLFREMTRKSRRLKQKKTVVENLSETFFSKDFEFWEPYWGYERPPSHRRPAGYMKEWKILEWALPHSCWRRTRAWLVGKSHPETSNNCENVGGQFDDVEQAAVGDKEDIEQKKT